MEQTKQNHNKHSCQKCKVWFLEFNNNYARKDEVSVVKTSVLSSTEEVTLSTYEYHVGNGTSSQ